MVLVWLLGMGGRRCIHHCYVLPQIYKPHSRNTFFSVFHNKETGLQESLTQSRLLDGSNASSRLLQEYQVVLQRRWQWETLHCVGQVLETQATAHGVAGQGFQRPWC